MKPIILVTPGEGVNPINGKQYYFVRRAYAAAIAANGGSPFMAADPLLFEEYAQMADGLLLTDGVAALNPGRYGCTIDPALGIGVFDLQSQPYRDSFELSLCKAFIKEGKPVLGIGRGMHVLIAALGGTMTQPFTGDALEHHGAGSFHAVHVKEGSRLAGIASKAFFGFSKHNMTVDKLPDGMIVSAVSQDGIAEAVEHTEKPFFGVEWHPELLDTDDVAMFEKNDLLNDPADKPTPEETEKTAPFKCHKAADPSIPTDLDAPHPEEPLFAYFVELCRKGEH